ncbi:tetratricopeptide repeat protein [Paraburkholderia tagetis]|uniref:protein O-GlcNAc transferase n=1 Tax=Paraburkholderia tagetis TaxID=2913261 RepID=A0A9X1RQP3_9BURK|nr:tetratricopeptide repeat protein [Paraburkholderia tagetis]MCG5075020.1 tetratricopeptide repeat protein [Paraburkholderia tagetis]
MTNSTPESTLQAGTFADAVAAWRAGALDEARARCARLIAANAQHADALHLAGILETAHDRLAARALIERALALREDPNFLVSLGLTYDAASETQGAFAALERALAINPDFSIALNNLANLYAGQGDFPRALAAFERALALTPEYASAHYNYGSALLASGDAARAEAPLRRAVALDAGSVNAWNNLANVLIALQRTGEAQAVLEHARTLAPESANVLTNLGCLLRASGRHAEAQAALERALALAPHDASTWNNLGNVLVDLFRIDEARACFTRALELRPGFANAASNLGNAHKHAGDIEQALACYRDALACERGSIGAHSNYVYALMFATEDGHTIRAAAEQLSMQHEAALLAQPVAHANMPDAQRRLRIGYVSPDFRNHCQMLFTTPLFRHHDRAAFEIVCYSSVAQPDEVTARLASHADLWRDVREFDDARLAQQIRDDRIDILVDLTMHMDGARRLVFARRPAPVQVAWLAYPGTTGSAAIGWRLTDPWLDPLDSLDQLDQLDPSGASGTSGAPGVDDQYTERSLRLPDTFWCYDALAPGLEVNGLPALAAGHDGQITFGCLNNPCKLTDATLALWSGVFAALPTARLVLMAPPGAARERLAARLAAHGVDAARVRFVGFQAREDYLRTWAQIDIALDTFPYNGHTTSLDAFWMGVPVPTRVGRSAASRAGLSLLANLGLAELAAPDDAAYVELVVSLARDPARLAALRAGLRTRMAASPLMDGERFARNMEAAFRLMWRDWCARARPVSG